MSTEIKRNRVAIQSRRYKLLNWSVFTDLAEKYFNQEIKVAENIFGINFHFERNDEVRQIQFFAGQNAIGSIEKKRDALGRATEWKLSAERGATLVISQSEIGIAIITLYPYKSEKTKRIQEHIIWKVLDDPAEITARLLAKVTKDFYCYIRVSSALFSESRMDRLRIFYLEIRCRKYMGGGSIYKLIFSHWIWVVLGAISSIVTIYLWLKGNSGNSQG